MLPVLPAPGPDVLAFGRWVRFAERLTAISLGLKSNSMVPGGSLQINVARATSPLLHETFVHQLNLLGRDAALHRVHVGPGPLGRVLPAQRPGVHRRALGIEQRDLRGTA